MPKEVQLKNNMSEIIQVNSDIEDENTKNEEYYVDTLDIIQKNILEYIESNSLPLCEYLSLKDIKRLLYKTNNF